LAGFAAHPAMILEQADINGDNAVGLAEAVFLMRRMALESP